VKGGKKATPAYVPPTPPLHGGMDMSQYPTRRNRMTDMNLGSVNTSSSVALLRANGSFRLVIWRAVGDLHNCNTSGDCISDPL
jgi:hypothetical protein